MSSLVSNNFDIDVLTKFFFIVNAKAFLTCFYRSYCDSFTGVKRFVYISAMDFGFPSFFLRGYYEGKVSYYVIKLLSLLPTHYF